MSFFHQASVPHPFQGTRYVQGHHDGVLATIKDVLPLSGEEHHQIRGGPSRSEPKLLVREEVVFTKVTTDCLCHDPSNTFPTTDNRERDGPLVFWVRS